MDESSPIDGPRPHVFVADADPSVCVCGRARFTGVHVANDGTPLPDLGGLVEALQAVSDACQFAIAKLLGGDCAG